jgi:flagellar basal-body rod modification protein FlgD
MTSPIPAAPLYAAAASNTQTAATTAPSKTLDQDAFLKLLVAQLKYQDPSKPLDASQMMAQTATFTQVQKLDQLLTAQQSMVSGQHMEAASSMVGRTVTATTTDGVTATGVVLSATFTGSEPTLRVGNRDVPLSSVTEVRSNAG